MTKRVLSGFVAALFVVATSMALIGCGEDAPTATSTLPKKVETPTAPAMSTMTAPATTAH